MRATVCSHPQFSFSFGYHFVVPNQRKTDIRTFEQKCFLHRRDLMFVDFLLQNPWTSLQAADGRKFCRFFHWFDSLTLSVIEWRWTWFLRRRPVLVDMSKMKRLLATADGGRGRGFIFHQKVRKTRVTASWTNCLSRSVFNNQCHRQMNEMLHFIHACYGHTLNEWKISIEIRSVK